MPNIFLGSITCSACAKGSAQSKEGQATCNPCDAGTFSEKEGAKVCTNCAAGTFSKDTGKKLKTENRKLENKKPEEQNLLT